MDRRHHARLGGRWLAATVSICTAVGIGLISGPQLSAAAPTGPHGAGNQQGAELKPSYDARTGSTRTARQVLSRKAAAAAARPATAQLRDSLGTQAVVELDGLTGTPRMVARLDGFLTGPAAGRPADVAMGYVRSHLAGFGLTQADLSTMSLSREYVDIEGIHHLSWVQRAGGVPLFGNGLKAHVTRDGRLIAVQGAPVSGLSAPAAASGVTSGKAAIGRARGDLGDRSTAAGPNDTAQAVLFATPTGTRRAWQTVTMSSAHPALHVIDAVDGRVLFRRSLGNDATPTEPSAADAAAKDPADGIAYRYFPKAAHGGSQVPTNFTANGWLAANAKKLTGNNTHTYADVDDNDEVTGNEEIPPRHGNSWDYPLKPFHLDDVSFCDNPSPCSWNPDVPFSWRVNRNQNATQVFYFVNTWHDHLLAAPIGFTEAAGNFEAHNTSGHGKGHDAVEAQTDDGANTDNGLPDSDHIDNANMETPPDGQAPRMQMYLQHQPGTTYPDGDPFSPTNVGDEADTVYHEYTHGLSNRLVVDATGNSTLGEVQAGAMGEAWGDWYAMDYLVAKGLQADTAADGDIVMFQYDGEGVFLDRTEPVDCAVGSTSPKCPGTATSGPGGYTYGDYGHVGGSPEVHDDGEIWAQTLWDLRTAVGSKVAESLVTRAMELAANNPSFLDMRNAILLADHAVFNGYHVKKLWQVFAHRGMGFFAGALDGNDIAPGEDFSTPPAPGTPKGTLTGIVTDSVTGAPLAGATVTVAFQGTPSGSNPSAITNANGRYTIHGLIAGTYPKVIAMLPGFDSVTASVTVQGGTRQHNFTVTRDWASLAGGAEVTAFDGDEFPGCGPTEAIDQSFATGWSATADLVNGQPGPDTPKSMTVRLPQAVDITQVAVDPSATCGDGGSASTGDYTIETSVDGTSWQLANSGQFTPDDRGRLNALTPAAGTADGIQFIRFTIVTSQVFQVGECPGAFSGCDFMDLTELEVYGS